MQRAVWAGCLAVLAAGGCTTIDRFNGLDGPPGGYVSGTSPFHRTMSSLNPFGDYNEQWTLVRVIAPPGATRCRIVDGNPFSPDGPLTSGAPDARREVKLAYDANATFAEFECRTPAGAMKRRVDAVAYTWPEPFNGFKRAFPIITQVKPPLVHIDPSDPEAEQRWRELAAEICPVVSERASGFACKPGMMEQLKAKDLQRAG